VLTHARARAFLESVAKRRILLTTRSWRTLFRYCRPFHPSGDGSPGASNGGGRGGGPPFIAALAISKARGGLPGPGFFDCARRLGRFAGDPDGQDARTFHAAELNAVFACWSGSGDN